MRTHGRRRAPRWVLLVLGVAVAAGHVVVLRWGASRVALPATALAGVVVLLIVVKHLALAGAFGALRRALVRRRAGR
jgi:hypothetical protein